MIAKFEIELKVTANYGLWDALNLLYIESKLW